MSNAADVLWTSVVCGMRGVGGVCEMCMCLTRGGVVGEEGWVDERIGFGLYQSCGNNGSVGGVSLFGLRWCVWCRCGVVWVEAWNRVWRSVVVLCLRELWVRILCVDGRYCAWQIPVYLRCTQCSILLHLMGICFLPCICVCQTCMCVVVGPGFVSTSPAIMRSSANHSAAPHGRFVQNTVNRASITGGGMFRHNLHSSL